MIMSLTVTMCALVPRHNWSCLWNQITAFSFISSLLGSSPTLWKQLVLTPTWAMMVACIQIGKLQGGLGGDRVSCNNINLSVHADNSAESPKRWLVLPCSAEDIFQTKMSHERSFCGKWRQCRRGVEEVLMGWEMDCFGNILSPIFSILVWFLGLQLLSQFQLQIENNNSLTEGFKSAWMLQAFHPPRKQAPWAHEWGVGAETGRSSWGWIQVGFF